MTKQENNISPDGNWKVIIENNQIRWVQLTEPKSQYTIKELVEATKAIAPEIWKNEDTQKYFTVYKAKDVL